MDIHAEDRGVVPTLTTGDLTLRPLARSDRDRVVAALNDWEVTRWLTMVPYPYAPADFDWFLDNFIPETGHKVWAIDAGDGLIGCVGVHPELGYWLAPKSHGKGVMTRAATRVVAWHFDHSEDGLTSGYHLGNGASARVLDKLGFQATHVEQATTARGDAVRTQRVALSRAEWNARHD